MGLRDDTGLGLLDTTAWGFNDIGLGFKSWHWA